MLLVRNVMTEDVKTVSPEMDAYDAAGVMRSHDVGSAPVVDGDGHLVGIVTDRDLVIRSSETVRIPRGSASATSLLADPSSPSARTPRSRRRARSWRRNGSGVCPS
jgi:CBS domain-containing protein